MPRENLLRFLKKIADEIIKSDREGIDMRNAGKSLGFTDEEISKFSDSLKSIGYIEDNSQVPGFITITEKGTTEINKLTLSYKFKAFFDDLVKPLWKQNISAFFYAVFLWLVFAVFKPALDDTLNHLFVLKILILFHPTVFFDILFIISACIFIKLYNKRNIRTGDFFLLLIYIQYRFFDQYWHFTTIFSSIPSIHFPFIYADFLLFYYISIPVYRVYNYYQQKRDPPNYQLGFLYPDLDIARQSTAFKKSIVEIDREGLNRNHFASQLADIIDQIKPFQAFAIGICGSWGSGKTSLIKLIISNLKAKNKQHYIYIEFSPWFFSNTENLILNFFSLLEREFSLNKTLAHELKHYGKEIAMIEKSVLKSQFSKFFFEEDKTLSERYTIITNQLKKENKQIIISIDDLDRLHKKEIVDVFRLIRLIADFPNTFYIVGYDKSYVTSAIHEELTGYNSDKYIDKIFNLEFQIPIQEASGRRTRLKTILSEQITLIGDKGAKISKEELDKIFSFEPVAKFLTTERDIKRFSNNLMMRFLAIHEEINFYHLYLVELIYFAGQDIYNRLLKNGEEISSALKKPPEKSNPINLVIPISEIIELDSGHSLNYVLSELFNRQQRTVRFSISNPLYFYRYFSLSLLASDFSTADFDKALKLPSEELKVKLVEFNTRNSALLAEQLEYSFPERKIEDYKFLVDFIDGLLYLYHEIYQINRPFIDEGLNRNNLWLFVMNIIINSTQEISFLRDRIDLIQVTDYAAFGFFADIEFLHKIPTAYFNANKEECFQTFRKIQLDLFEKERMNNFYEFSTGVVRQLQYGRRYILVNETIGYNKEHETWFAENFIKQLYRFPESAFEELRSGIKSRSYGSGMNFDSDLCREQINAIFHRITMDVYDNEKFENIRDLYEGYDTKNVFSYSFKNSIPAGSPGSSWNDEYYPSNFEIKDHFVIEVFLDPIQTSYWRFGLRFNASNIEFVPGTPRHTATTPILHLSKGEIKETESKDYSPPRLTIAQYDGLVQKDEPIVLENYDNKPINFMFVWETNDQISFNFKKGEDWIVIKTFSGFGSYRYVQIGAWADFLDFSLSAKIKLLEDLIENNE